MDADRRMEMIELDYERTGKFVSFNPGLSSVSLDGRFTAAELRRFADALDAEGAVTPAILNP